MGSRQLEELQDQENEEAVAGALRISVEDLNKTNYRIEIREGHDNIPLGHTVYFDEGSDPDVLKKIDGLVDGEWIWIGPFPEGEYDEDE